MFLTPLRKNGFTLIELLVVVSIISLLGSIVSVSLKSAREEAKIVRAARDLEEIGKAFNLWMDQENRMKWFIKGEVCPSCAGNANAPAPIKKIMETPQSPLNTFLPAIPIPPWGGVEYRYVHGQQIQTGECASTQTNVGQGINLSIFGTGLSSEEWTKVFDRLDELLDGPLPPGLPS